MTTPPADISDLTAADALALLELVVEARGPLFVYGNDGSLVPGWDEKSDTPILAPANEILDQTDCLYIHYDPDEPTKIVPGCMIAVGLAILDPDGWTEIAGVQDNELALEVFAHCQPGVVEVVSAGQTAQDRGYRYGEALERARYAAEPFLETT